MSNQTALQPTQAEESAQNSRTRAACCRRRSAPRIPANEQAELAAEYGTYLAHLVVADHQRNWMKHVG